MMPSYRNFSPDEIRLKDYELNRRFGNTPVVLGFGGSTSGFGATNTGSAFGATGGSTFGASSNSPFGSTANKSAFGQPSNLTFGSSTSTFGQNNGSAFGLNTGGAFGSSTNTGNAFGSSNTGSGFGATNSAFGATQNQNQPFGATTSAFGAPSNTTSTGGLFGSSTNNNTNASPFGGSSAFGQNNTNNASPFGQSNNTSAPFGQSSTSNVFGSNTGGTGFGSNSGSAFGSSGSAFGGANNNTGGLFGQNNQNTNTATSGGLFGQSNTNTASNPFGSKPGGLFGQNNQTTQNTGSTFGSGTSGFGQNSTTGGGLFGSKPAQTGGLFGNNNQNNTANNSSPFGATNAFGANQNQNQNQNQTTTGGLFGSKPATGGLFGGQSTTNNTGFGNNQSTNTSGGLFGNKPATTGGGLFGGGNNTTSGGGLFGGSSNTGSTGVGGGTSGGLFGGSGNTNTTGGLFGSKPAQTGSTFGGSNTGSGNTSFGTGGGLFGQNQQQSQQPQQQQQQSQQSLLSTQNPYGQNPLFLSISVPAPGANGPSGPVAVPVKSAAPKKPVNLGNAHRLAPLFRMSVLPRKAEIEAEQTRATEKTQNGLFGVDTDVAISSSSIFRPQTSVRKLIVDKVQEAGKKLPALIQVAAGEREPPKQVSMVLDSGRKDEEEINGTSSPKLIESEVVNGSQPGSEQDEIDENGYWTSPSILELKRKPLASLRSIEHFKVGRKNYGHIEFLQPVDLSLIVNLDDIAGNLIIFDSKSCVVYPDDDKPKEGEGFNLPAIITLNGCYPVNKADKLPILDPKSEVVKKHIDKLKLLPEMEFQLYEPQSGDWTFKVTSM